MKRFRVNKKNKIHFMQDFQGWEGLPVGVVFDVEPGTNDNSYWIKAPGYGAKPYGNGKILIYKTELESPGIEWL